MAKPYKRALRLSSALLLFAAISSLIVLLPYLVLRRSGREFARPTKKAPVDPLFRGMPLAHWREQIKEGNVRFGGWTGSVTITNGEEHEVLFAGEEKHRDLVPLFIALLHDPDPDMRGMGAFGLGSYGTLDKAGAAAALCDALADEDEDVQWQSARALDRIGADLTEATKARIEEIWRRNAGKEKISYGTSSFTDADMLQVRRWTNLRGLNLSGSTITDAGLVHLSGLRRLSSLNLSGTKVTDEGLVCLEAITSLCEINVANTAVTDVGAARLQRALPQVHIIRHAE